MPYAEAAFIGEIATYGFYFAPRGWVYCNGSYFQIAQNQAMYSLIGNLYGGDGRTTYAVPNFNSRMPTGAALSGSHPGLDPYGLAQYWGWETNTLNSVQLPAHSHTAEFAGVSPPDFSVDIGTYVSGADIQQPKRGDLLAASGDTRFRSPGGFGEPNRVTVDGLTAKGEDLLAATVKLDDTGGGTAFQTRNPVTAVNFCICEDGTYPPRS